MEIQVNTQSLNPEFQILTIEGELDIAAIQTVKEKVDHLLNKGCRNLVLNLSNLDFIDTTGMEALIHAVGRIHQCRGALTFVSANPRIMKVFDIMGLSKSEHFKIFKTEEEALQGLAVLAPQCRSCAVRSIPFCSMVKSMAYPAPPCVADSRLPWLAVSDITRKCCC